MSNCIDWHVGITKTWRIPRVGIIHLLNCSIFYHYANRGSDHTVAILRRSRQAKTPGSNRASRELREKCHGVIECRELHRQTKRQQKANGRKLTDDFKIGISDQSLDGLARILGLPDVIQVQTPNRQVSSHRHGALSPCAMGEASRNGGQPMIEARSQTMANIQPARGQRFSDLSLADAPDRPIDAIASRADQRSFVVDSTANAHRGENRAGKH
jgi:hypothetical protein